MSVEAFDQIREQAEQSVFATGMTKHLRELPAPALNRYLAEFLPAAVAASGFEAREIAEHFLDMTMSVMRQQTVFNRTGRPGEVFPLEGYEDEELMERFYLNGLSAALVFWPNHWEMLRFFEDRVIPLPLPEEGRCLDVGCGPGIFSARFGQCWSGWDVTSLDISSFAVGRTRRLWAELELGADRHRALHQTVGDLLAEEERTYDAILFSELVEHLDDGPQVLEQLARRLAPDGVMFFTTALNSYFPDHRIYFNRLDEVHAMIEAAGLYALDLQSDEVADTPHGPQADVYALLVRPDSKWVARLAAPSAEDSLHHIGYLTRDLERSRQRWLDRGAELLLGPVTDLGMDCRVAFLRAPGTAALIELVSPYSEESPLARRIDRNPLDHLAYSVRDLDAAIAAREQLGARVVHGPTTASAFRSRVAFALDGDGLLTELIEHNQERPWLV
jgi:2-polyprenyl-3-methyl-5-hydroxy-6-metoxy-1,4-benzoquinol methylase/catechol 2,3-dioxygenase-like lactoylglutathione lyase family enzyme